MKRARFIAAVCVLFVVLPVLAADSKCKSVTGHFDGVPTAPGVGTCPLNVIGCTNGHMNGGIQGDYTFIMSSAAFSTALGGLPSVAFFVARSTIATKSGDVTGTHVGSYDIPYYGGTGALTSVMTFTGGATGQIRLTGQFSAEANQTSGDFTGTFCQ